VPHLVTVTVTDWTRSSRLSDQPSPTPRPRWRPPAVTGGGGAGGGGAGGAQAGRRRGAGGGAVGRRVDSVVGCLGARDAFDQAPPGLVPFSGRPAACAMWRACVSRTPRSYRLRAVAPYDSVPAQLPGPKTDLNLATPHDGCAGRYVVLQVRSCARSCHPYPLPPRRRLLTRGLSRSLPRTAPLARARGSARGPAKLQRSARARCLSAGI